MSAKRLFVAIDVETGGLNPETDALLEVGLVVERADGSTFEEAFTIPSEANDKARKITDEALRINRYFERLLAGKLPRPMGSHFAAGLLLELTRDKHLIGQNPQFDAAFLANFMRRHGVEPAWHHRLVDLGSLAWGFHNGAQEYLASPSPWPQPPNTQTVQRLLGEPNDEEHTALGDARWAYRVFRQIVPRPGPPYPPRQESAFRSPMDDPTDPPG